MIMKQQFILLALTSILISGCAATYEGAKKDWKDSKPHRDKAWETTKEVSGKAWEATKEVSGKAWEAGKEAVSSDSEEK